MDEVGEQFTLRFWKYQHSLWDHAGFASWVARHPELRSQIGDSVYDRLVNMPPVNSQANHELRDHLASWAVSSAAVGCPCSTWGDQETLTLGYETANLREHWFRDLKARTPWLDLVECVRCGQRWYAAYDTVDDQLHFLRVTKDQAEAIVARDEWPSVFDSMENVWPAKET